MEKVCFLIKVNYITLKCALDHKTCGLGIKYVPLIYFLLAFAGLGAFFGLKCF